MIFLLYTFACVQALQTSIKALVNNTFRINQLQQSKHHLKSVLLPLATKNFSQERIFFTNSVSLSSCIV